MSEETTASGDVESRIEERLFPTPPAENEAEEVDNRPRLEAVPDDSEPVAKIDSNEISEIPDGDESKAEDEVKAEKPKAEKPKEPESEEEAFHQFLGIEEDYISYDDETGEPRFRAKVGEDEFNVSFKDLLKSYQLEKHINNKSIALSEKQKEFDESYGDFQTKFTERLSQADQLAELMEKNLLGDYNSIDWDNLKQANPTEYAVRKQEFAEKAESLQKTKDALQAERQQISEHQNQVMQRKFEAFKAQQAEILLTTHPEWLDPNVMKRELTEVQRFVQEEYGFTEQEMDNIYDSRIINVLIDAKNYRAAKKGVEAKGKKEVPKFQKPGQRISRTSAAAKEAKAKRAALRQTGRQAELVNVLTDRM